jgi:hypothetical protein
MRDANGAKERIHALILPPVCVHGKYFMIKHTLNKRLKFFKELKNFKFAA